MKKKKSQLLTKARGDELKKLTTEAYKEAVNRYPGEDALNPLVDEEYRRLLTELPTDILEDIIKAHEQYITRRHEPTLFAIKNELANRVLLNKNDS